MTAHESEVSGADGGASHAYSHLVDELRNQTEPARGGTALLDEEMTTFGVPNPRILVVGCGGSGNNTLNSKSLGKGPTVYFDPSPGPSRYLNRSLSDDSMTVESLARTF